MMNKILIGALMVVAIPLLVYIAYSSFYRQEVISPKGEPTFTWIYASSTVNEIPKTQISITATYPDGTTNTKKVDTVDGECNAYDNSDPDMYAQSNMIICYYAGFGGYYKVVKKEGNYSVERKYIEESSPDYTPPNFQYEPVVSF